MAGTFRKMYRFWQTILLEEHTTRKPFPPHKQLPAKEHFDRWMEIFTSTTDELFAGATEEAKLRAKNMAEMFNYKINYFKCWTNGDLLNLK
jgi:hemoglobin